jgi:hypothetical protein
VAQALQVVLAYYGVLGLARQTKPPERALEVLNYFVRNPRAADTLEGVARWRLLEETVRRGLDDTEKALDWLVNEGYLKRISTPYTAPIYELNRDEQVRAKEFLAQTKTAPKRRRKS